jgi:hypothetical protein
MMLQSWREFLSSLRNSFGASPSLRKSLVLSRPMIRDIETLECRVMPAYVLSIAKSDPVTAVTSASSVSYEVDFDSDVTGVDPSDFRVTTSGSAVMQGALVVTPTSASTYTVTLNGLVGSGSIRLDLIDDDSILDTEPSSLGGLGLYNGSFQGDSYQLRQPLPTVLSIDRTSPINNTTNASSVTYTVTFNLPVTGVTANNFKLAVTDATTVTGPINVSGNGAVYTVTVSGISGTGTLQLNLADQNDSIHDLAGNPLASPLGAEFSGRQLLDVGETTDSIVLADLNQDGIPDLIGASNDDGNVVVALGVGNGTFQTPQAYAVGATPVQVLANDVNGDGLVDLITLDPSEGTFSILIGNGDGTFQPVQLIYNEVASVPPSIAYFPSHAVLEDGGGDGIPDLLAIDDTQDQAAFFDGTDDGFIQGFTLSTGTLPTDVALSDLRGVGQKDLIVTSAGDNTVTVYQSNGDRGYDAGTVYPVGNGPASLVIGDFNGDGRPDIATANRGDNTISVLLADSSGGFLAAQSYAGDSGPGDIEAADLNGDGLDDLLVFNRGDGKFTLWIGQSDGTFANPLTYDLLQTPTSSTFGNLIAVGDLNGDGRSDLVFSDPQSNNVRIVKSIVSADYLGQIYTIQGNLPSFTSPNHAEVDENTAASTVVLDVDATISQGVATYSLSGTDSNSFSIDSQTGELRFLASPDYENPTDGGHDNVYNVTVTVADGGGGGATQDVAVTVLPVNDNAPVVTSVPSVNVNENTPASTVILNIVATDADRPLQTLTYDLGGSDASRFSVNSNTGEVRFLASPDFEAPTDLNHDNVYDIIVLVNDGNGKITPQSVSIKVLPLDDNAPLIDSPAAASVNENSPVSTIILDVDATDADRPLETLTYGLSGTDAGLFSIDSTTGEIRFLASPDFEAPADSGKDNVYDFIVTVSDGKGQATSQTISISVLPLNDNAPVVTSSATVDVDENTPAADVILKVIASDADRPVQALTYSLSGFDAGLFTIDNTTGEIRFLISPDFENSADSGGGNVYNFTVNVSDGQGAVTPQDITVTVLPINDNAPVVHSPAAVAVDENTPAGTVILDVDATDADLPAQTLTYSLGGIDAGLFSIDSATGEIRFLASPDFESPADVDADNLYLVTVTVSDGSPTSMQQDLAISVLPVNDNAPVLNSSPVVSINENTPAPTVILTVSATDADRPAQTLIYALSGPDATRFSIDGATGEVRFLTSPDFEAPADAGRDNVYNLTVQVDDGAGNVTPQDLVISVLPINDNVPIVSSLSTVNVDENTPATTVILQVAATDADLPAQTLSYSLGGVDAGRFSIDSVTGEIRFLVSPDFEVPADSGADNTYNITAIVSDGLGVPTSQAIMVEAQPVNDNAPVISAPAAVSIDENTPAKTVILTVSATDADLPSQTVTYGLAGADATLFSIDNTTGAVRFLISPDFEAPGDAGADNVYDLIVTADDGNGEKSIQNVTVTVLPVNDNIPVINSPAAVSIDENTPTTSVILTVAADDADLPAQTLTYSLGGVDSSHFHIDSTTGEIRFLTSPDFEAPADGNADNVYNLTVSVSDGSGLTGTQDVSLTVLPVNDNAPVFTSSGTVVMPENVAVVGTVTAVDADLPSDSLTYSIQGGVDSGFFTINATTGILSFRAAPDFERPLDVGADNVYEVTLKVDDGKGLAETQNVTVKITNVDEPLVIDLPDPPFTYDPGMGPIPVDFGAFATDPDTFIADFRGGTLTINLDSPDANDQIFVKTEGNGPGLVSVLYGNIVFESSLVIVGTITSGESGGPLVISLTSFATPAALDAILQAVYFQTSGTAPIAGTRTVTYEIANAPGTALAVNSKTINVTTGGTTPVVSTGGDTTDGSQSEPLIGDAARQFIGSQLSVELPANSNHKARLSLRSENGIRVKGRNVLFQGQKIGTVAHQGKSLQVNFTTHAATTAAVRAVVHSVGTKLAPSHAVARTQVCHFVLMDTVGGKLTQDANFDWLVPQN